MPVARDIENFSDLESILLEAEILLRFCDYVIVVPKAIELIDKLELIPEKYILGYSVSAKYGRTKNMQISIPDNLTSHSG
jgi:hypothetical protein